MTWFDQTAKATFEALLGPHAGKPDLKFLQLGVFRGDASVWLMENILTHPTSVLWDVDPWADMGLNELSSYDMEEVFSTYLEAVKEYDRVLVSRLTSNDFFSMESHDDEFDFVYIDGDHHPINILEDAVHAYRALKPWGLLAFDDYLWGADKPVIEKPSTAIDMIKILYGGRLDTVAVGDQVWMCKRGSKENAT